MPSFLHRTVPARLLILGPAAIVLALGLLLFVSARQVDTASTRVEQTYRILLAQEHLLERILDAETAARGYLLTGDTLFLAPYHGARGDVRRRLDELERLTRGAPAQREHVLALSEAAMSKLATVDLLIATRREHGLEAALPLLETGRAEMDRVRELAERIQAGELRLLEDLRAAHRRQGGLLTLVAVIGGLLAGGASYLAGRGQHAQVAAERRARAELQIANERLRERTDELKDRAAEAEVQARRLREREARLRRIAESDMIGVLFWTLGGRITYANDYLLQLVGYTPDDVARERIDWRAITPPEWAPVDDRAIELVKAHGVARSFEKEYLHRNGLRVPVLLSAAVFEGSEQEGVTLVVDLSARKAAERALAEEAELRRLALEAARMGTWEMDLSTGRTRWDSRTQQIVGRVVDGPIGMEEAIASIHPDDRTEAMERARVLSIPGSLEEYSMEKRIVRPDGTIRWTYWSGRRLEGSDEKPPRVVGTVQDITERLAAEDALRTSEQNFRRLAESIPQLVWTARPDGHLEYSNERWHEFTGIPADDGGDGGWLSSLHPEDGARTAAVWRRSLATGEPFEIEFRFRRLDGEHRWFLGRALPLRSDDGEIIRWFGTLTDVDEQKRTRDELERLYREVEEANRTKAEFLGTMSHELRTPLNAILGYADLLELGVPHPLEPEALRYVQRITLAAKHQHQLIEEVLAFNRLEAGRETVYRERVPVPAILAEVTAVIAPQAERKSLAFRTESRHGPDEVETDPRKLRQILLNLVGNAVKFTARGHVALIVEGDAGCIRFVVEDTGPGIGPEEREKIFEPFWQADRSHTREAGGAGLGLAISRRFAELLGGMLRVENRPDGGSRFTLSLPLEPPGTGIDRGCHDGAMEELGSV
jgi:PAS domain S-box-containing protein